MSRPTGFPPDVKLLIQTRARGICERCGYGSSDCVAHHRRPRGLGGSKRVDTNTASNGVWLCGECHRHVESYRSAASSDGWLVRQSQCPAEVPVYRRGRWVLLDDAGTCRSVEAA